MDAASIEKWALKHPRSAVQLGRDLYEASQTGEDPPHRGETQDEIVAWVQAHPIQAKMLFLKLMGKLSKYA